MKFKCIINNSSIVRFLGSDYSKLFTVGKVYSAITPYRYNFLIFSDNNIWEEIYVSDFKIMFAPID